MKSYAIIDNATGEFYPDPIYTDIKRATDKIMYLEDYRAKNHMDEVIYKVEVLTPKRLEQHETEWKKWVSMID